MVPQILVTATTPEMPHGSVTLRERITLEDLESTHFAHQLLERLTWAIGDAHDTEEAHGAGNTATDRASDSGELRR